MKEIMFENFISLGAGCQVAASMSKFGLRSWSGVFDWLFTASFEWILYYIEKDFKGFLEKSNLEISLDNPNSFKEKNSGFVFLHEGVSLDEGYELIKEKYRKRIERFLYETTKNTCFLRAVRTNEEIEYIKNNYEYINTVVRKNNPNNQIIFLVENGREVDALPFRYYKMKRCVSAVSRYVLRSWFDDEKDFLEFCGKHSDSEKLIRNIVFDNQSEARYYQSFYIWQGRYNLLVKLLETDWNDISLPGRIVIYGAGNVGKQFYGMIKEKCEVVAFVDKSKKGIMDNVPIVNTTEIGFEGEYTYIITTTYDYECICNEIRIYDKEAQIISLEKIMDKR